MSNPKTSFDHPCHLKSGVAPLEEEGKVSRRDWLWKALNVHVKKKFAALYVGSSLTKQSSLFSVQKLWLNCDFILLVNKDKNDRNAVERHASSSPRKQITK